MGWITSLQDMIYGDDGQSPIRPTLVRVLNQAKQDDLRLSIEIRAKAIGSPNSRQEHKFAADPTTATIDGIMRVLVQRLEESPGEHFAGELRINFSAAGSSQERYGSFTRTIRRTPPNVRGAPGMHGMRTVHEEGEEEDEVDNDAAALGGFDLSSLGGPMGGQPTLVSQEMMIQWLETTMGFVFRSQAQQMAMFERATRMMESYTLRFGMQHATERGITEQVGGGGEDQSGFGLLPMLIKAAGHMANAKSPDDLAERVGSLAQNNAPPRSHTRTAAIAGAARLVQGIPRGGDDRFQPYDPTPPAPDHDPDPDLGGGSAGGFFDNEGGDDFDMANYPPDSPANTGPDLRGMNPDQVKEVFVQWIRDDPENKDAVMGMLPELGKEVLP